jgi:antitoxin component of MazEF toxin-antitoxin module
MPERNEYPARLYNQGGNTVVAIPRAICRELGLTPRSMVTVAITEGGRVVITRMESVTDERTPLRRSTTRPTARA